MSDEIDRANDQAQKLTEQALLVRKPTGPTFTGFCHTCLEPLPSPRRWCDFDCAQVWEKENSQ